MGGESSSSTYEGGLEISPLGSETELLRIGAAELYLQDGEESALMQTGDFIFQLVKQTGSSLAAAIAAVADVQWPVGKDAPVIKVGRNRYAFCGSNLVYSLSLHTLTAKKEIEKLEALLLEYSTFEIPREINTVDDEEAAAEYWTSLASDIVAETERKAQAEARLGSLTFRQGLPINLAPTNFGFKNANLEVSPRMMKRIQQARRMSAVSKLLSKTLVRGAIHPIAHVAKGEVGTSSLRLERRRTDVADTDAFIKLAEAVETAGRSLVETPEEAQNTPKEGSERMGNSLASTWTLNKKGLRVLFRAAAAYTAMAINLAVGSQPSSSGKSTLSENSRPFSSQASEHGIHVVEAPRPAVRFMPTIEETIPSPAATPQSTPVPAISNYSAASFQSPHFSDSAAAAAAAASSSLFPAQRAPFRSGSSFQQYRRAPVLFQQQRSYCSSRPLDEQPKRSQ